MQEFRLLVLLACLTAVVRVVAAQEFEVASIRPSAIAESGDISRPAAVRSTIEYSADGLRTSNYALRPLIAEAYQVSINRFMSKEDPEKVLGLRYDIAAKSEQPASKNELRLMLQALLVDRFQISFHMEAKQKDVYRLVARKGGIKIEKSNAEMENAHWETGSGGRLYYRDATADKFGDMLELYFGRPVLPSNDFEGLYNFPFPPNPTPYGDGLDIIIDLLQRFGLDLVKDKAVLDYLVVDTAVLPSEN